MSTYKKLNRRGIHTALAALSVMASQPVWAEALNTQLPTQQEETFSVPVNVDIPAQPLANSLHDLGKATGMNISFPNDVVSGKTAPEVRGRMTRKEALQRVLGESGLVPKVEGNNIFIQKPPKEAKKDIQLDKVEVRAKRFYEVGPLPGLGLTKEEIPGNVQSISAKEIKEAHALSITDLMNRKLQSVNVNDYQGNPFQMDVTYRGFTAGPQIGTPQGLSVFIDGIRVNEPFGDVVNWDMIPMNALASIDVFPGSNPIFGLNTLGGAFSLKTKDGFNNSGVDADVLTGSFGRKQLQVEGGWNNGTIGLFAAGNFFLEDGWRQNSPSKVNQLFTKASYRGEKLDLNLSSLFVKTDLVGNGLIPTQMYEQDRNSVFTSPDTTKNNLSQFQLSGSYFVDDTFTVTGQIYRRNSRRHSLGADAYTDGFAESEPLKRNLAAGEVGACQFLSTNSYGLPDYYVLDLTDPNDPTSNAFVQDFYTNSGDPAYDQAAALASFSSGPNPTIHKNGELTQAYANNTRNSFNYWSNYLNTFLFDGTAVSPPEPGPFELYSNGQESYMDPGYFYDAIRGNTFNVDPNSIEGFGGNYFYTPDGVKHIVLTMAPINKATCQGSGLDIIARDANGNTREVEGRTPSQTGTVEGVPVSVLSDNRIDQVVNGGSMQFNWNLDKHKLMIGLSLDSATASYKNKQRLGLFDESRNAYIAPDQILDEYAAADVDISNNNFKGTSVTKSIYFSDTWSPIETLHINAAARYNQTHVKNKVATRTQGDYFALGMYRAMPDFYNLCIGSVDNCPTTGYRAGNGSQLLKPAETEKFSFYSLNPSLGATWQFKETINVYGNWAQGTRTPSVVELGCAFDARPSGFKARGPDKNGNNLPDPDELIDVPRSLAENRSCTLPTTLAGDPFLPQIKANTFDLGLRGTIGEELQWNIGAYQTDLKDDIYLVSVGAANSFFQTVGKTRRRGIEAGLSGKKDRWSFGVNYALTDATFQDSFDMISNHNSSGSSYSLGLGLNEEAFRTITVEPGDRMPGVPLHNLNATVGFEVTDKWKVGLTAVAHSESFVRGNENNEHRTGVIEPILTANGLIPGTRPTTNPGSVPGYTVFNFQTSYKLSKEWTASFIMNNIFDKEYFSAGRLGVNPFSPSINGAIGPGGWNHNSTEWLSSNFLAPGAPRGIWFSLNWRFSPD